MGRKKTSAQVICQVNFSNPKRSADQLAHRGPLFQLIYRVCTLYTVNISPSITIMLLGLFYKPSRRGIKLLIKNFAAINTVTLGTQKG